MKILVGHLRVEYQEGYHRMFEYAGSGEIWNLDAAVILLYFTGYWVVGQRPGTRVDSWFQSRIGACLGDDNRDTSHVKGEIGVQFDTHHAGRLVAAGQLDLAEGWQLVSRGEYHPGNPIWNIERTS